MIYASEIYLGSMKTIHGNHSRTKLRAREFFFIQKEATDAITREFVSTFALHVELSTS